MDSSVPIPATSAIDNRDTEYDIIGDDSSLHVRAAEPAGMPLARLAILPGYGDHSGRYVEFMRWMAARGMQCRALDFRGHGLSSGRRGYVRRWEEYLDDLSQFLSPMTPFAESPRTPTFLLGHSHGGLVAAAAGVRGLLGERVAGIVLISPFLSPQLHVSLGKLLAARAANVSVPWLRIKSGLRPEMMTSDLAMIEESRADPLLLRSATPRWYFGMLKAQAVTRARAAAMTLPLLCYAGTADCVASPAAAAAFCENASSADKTFRLLADRKHEILRETDRLTTFARILDWITAHVDLQQ